MPLVTLTCSKDFYPSDDELIGFTQSQEIAINLAQLLPGLIVDHAVNLGLDPRNTPKEGVQVDIRKFHSRAVNAPHLWIHIQFAEPYPGEEMALDVRDALIGMLNEEIYVHLNERKLNLKCALDMFWGPDHGCLMSSAAKAGLMW